MNSSSTLPSALRSDADLVADCLAGDRAAFTPIVERYQRLLCSLAYSATGQLSVSEDLAQEAFVEAWHQLPSLREPHKLRSWLCTILRYKVSRKRRSDGRNPAHDADALDATAEIADDALPAPDLAASHEEQAIMWSALERVPETYREPLVLYYREHNSIEHVAVALDLSEDAVKQRLSRGRKILQEQVLAFVEGALRRSTPGRLFTGAVIAALPAAFPTGVKAAGIGAAATQGGMIAKSAGLAAMLASFSGIISGVFVLRANLDQARTAAERRSVVKITIALFGTIFAFLLGLYAIREGAFRATLHQTTWAIAAQFLVLGFMVLWPWLVGQLLRKQRALRSAERIRRPDCFQDARDQIDSKAREYRSRRTLFGVPLVHIRFASPEEGDPPVFGWIAAGDRAYGLLMAWGGFAVAPVSVGICSIGILTVGSLSLGLVSLGTVCAGWLAIGCASIGVHAYAWLSALGWKVAAGGGFALAHDAALGPVAFAENANNQTAIDLLSSAGPQDGSIWFLVVISVFTLVPVALYANAVRQRFGRLKKR